MKLIPILMIAFALVFIIGASGCNQAAAPSETTTTPTTAAPTQTVQSGTVTVSITKYTFNPSEIIVTKGSRVIWVNNDAVVHTVKFDQNQFYSINYQIQPGKSASNYFNTVGTFTYHCTLHPSMTGKITVQ